MEMILVYTTFPDWESAEKVVKALLERKLIACANLREHRAFYWWQGKIEEDTEVGAILKTEVEKWRELRDAIKEMHPYEVPVIARIEVDKVNDEYAEWLEKVLS
ncbi:cation tolerance protein CutA [Thermococcus celericrescens]|uniref:Cation tolerance protein CutA n=2 Tax=Thermococcus TaxID=2263 RepID=A0A124EAY6_9EURY|nr:MULTISPECIES: divalent-cation tolerance protein CutA [Thermococcus]KUH31366.1 cation tolerance protein CutA [Thermococcus celericrescens]QEK15312.1 divalent-cation tolerance protein CutA [Thermococcus aciditolerans]